jgi:hypothetical protein
VERAAVNWLPGKTPYYQISDCGLFTICKIGGPHGVTYEAWRLKEQLAVGFQTADRAKEYAEQSQQARAA